MLLQELATKYVVLTDKLEELSEKQRVEKGSNLTQINDEIYDIENDLDHLEINFYSESQHYYIATLSKQSNKLTLTYSFFNEANDEIRVRFSFSKKGNSNNVDCWGDLDDGSFSFLEKIETMRLLELKGTTKVSPSSPETILLSIIPSIDISLSDFFKSIAKDFLDNYDTYVEKLGLKNYQNKDTFNSVSTLLNPLLYCLTESLKNLDSDLDLNSEHSKNLIKSFQTESYDIEDFMDFAKNKAKEYLYTDLNNNLKSDTVNNKKHKI